MKFKEIKEGDTVYIKRVVHDGFNRSRSFWVPAKVERVTPKQFVVNGERYMKSDGAMIKSGDWSYARKLGDDFNSGRKVTDQSEEMKLFIEAIRMSMESRLICDKLRRVARDHAEIENIYKALKSAERLFDEKKYAAANQMGF